MLFLLCTCGVCCSSRARTLLCICPVGTALWWYLLYSFLLCRPEGVLLRGTMVNRTYGTRKNLPGYRYIFTVFTNNISSYLLWSPANTLLRAWRSAVACHTRNHQQAFWYSSKYIRSCSVAPKAYALVHLTLCPRSSCSPYQAFWYRTAV